MNINFDKSDRLITIIENAVNLLSGAPYIVKYSSDVTDYPRQLCKAYWEMQDEIIFRADDKSKDNPDDWMRFLEETKFNERYLDILAKVIVRHEPTVKDIEKEFWANCTDVHSIDKFVNIYREHWKGHLHEMDENAFDCLGMKKESESLRNIISESLQNGSILKDDALYIETTLLHLARAVNEVTSGILNLFNRLSSPSAAGTKKDEAEADSNVYLNLQKGNKIDFIRVINALYELGFFCNRLNAKITKQDVFKEFGKCVNVDLSDYQKNLSHAKHTVNNDGNSNQTRIFERMQQITNNQNEKRM